MLAQVVHRLAHLTQINVYSSVLFGSAARKEVLKCLFCNLRLIDIELAFYLRLSFI